MVSSRKMTPWLMAIFCLATAGCSNITDQQTSESQHDQQVAILKQIRKVNDDGSYTFGYEAGDGSFKVETRDVLGNIKGTFGFVDANGEIKRVSYSSSNGTGFKATTLSPLQEHVSVVQSIPRLNRTSTTRKTPTVIYATTQESASRASVVQSIPRSRKPSITTTPPSSTSTASSTSTSTETQTKPIYRQYGKTTPRTRPRFIINGQQRPVSVEDETRDDDSQINRPNTDEKNSNYRRITFTKRPTDQNLRPITEEFEDKDDDAKIATGNTLRRQLPEETTKDPAPTMEHISDEHADVYGGALSTTRPLFTTNSPPRVLQRIVDFRSKLPKMILVNPGNVGPARFDDAKYESPRNYESDTKLSHEDRESPPPQQILIRAPEKPHTDSRDYARQSTEPVYVRQQPEAYVREVPVQRILVPAPAANHVEDEQPSTTYRAIPVSRILFRPVSGQQPVYTTTTDANIQYLTENPVAEPVNEPPRDVPNPPAYVRPRNLPRPPLPPPPPLVYEPEPRMRAILRPVSHPVDRDYNRPPPDYYRTSTIALPPEPQNPIPMPLSRRDFQILLKRLLVSQYGVQALNYPKSYLEDALYDQTPYPSYQPVYRAPLPREEVYETSTVPLRYGDRVPLRRPMYVRALYPANQYDDYPDERYSKRVYRQKVYTQEVVDDGDEILPAPIREALLLRMLQLAINAERPPVQLVTTTPTSRYRKTGPVRSVQIISDDEDEDKDIMRKKL